MEMYEEKSTAGSDWLEETQTEKPLRVGVGEKREERVIFETRNRAIGLMSRVFASSPGDRGSITQIPWIAPL